MGESLCGDLTIGPPGGAKGPQQYKAAFLGAEEGVVSTRWNRDAWAYVMGTAGEGTAERHPGKKVHESALNMPRSPEPKPPASTLLCHLAPLPPWLQRG